MSRAGFNFLLDCVLLLLLLALLWTSIVVRALFPLPSQAAGWSIWGLDYDAWSRLQFGFMIALALAVGLHLILHWTWVCGFVSGRLSRAIGRRVVFQESHRTIYGVVLLIAILSVMLALLFAAGIATRNPPGAAS